MAGGSTKKIGTPGAHTPKKPRTGGTNATGADCIWNETIPGCLVTNKQERICSNSVGSRLSDTRWSKGHAHRMILISIATGTSGRPDQQRTCPHPNADAPKGTNVA